MASSRTWRTRLVCSAGLGTMLIVSDVCVAQPAGGRSGDQELVRITTTIDELLDQAFELVEIAEKGGPDAEEARIEALRLANHVLNQQPLNVRAEFVLGRLAILEGRLREALGRIQQYVDDPIGQNDWKAWKLLGDLYVVSYPKHAETHYERAVELKQNEPEALIGLALAQIKRHLGDKAVETAEKAILNDTESKPEYREILSEALLLAKQYEQAVAAAVQAVQLTEAEHRDTPGDMDLLRALRNRYDRLAACMEVFIGFYPERSDYVIRYSQVIQDKADLERLMLYHRALGVVEEALAQTEGNPPVDLLYESARLSHMVGKDTEAVVALEKLLAIDPDHAAARELLETISPPKSANAGTSVGDHVTPTP